MKEKPQLKSTCKTSRKSKDKKTNLLCKIQNLKTSTKKTLPSFSKYWLKNNLKRSSHWPTLKHKFKDSNSKIHLSEKKLKN